MDILDILTVGIVMAATEMRKKQDLIAQQLRKQAEDYSYRLEGRKFGQKAYSVWRCSNSGKIQSPCLGRVWAFDANSATETYIKKSQSTEATSLHAVAQ